MRAVSKLNGQGKPCEMSVDSKATTGWPSRRALATSGRTSSSERTSMEGTPGLVLFSRKPNGLRGRVRIPRIGVLPRTPRDVVRRGGADERHLLGRLREVKGRIVGEEACVEIGIADRDDVADERSLGVIQPQPPPVGILPLPPHRDTPDCRPV